MYSSQDWSDQENIYSVDMVDSVDYDQSTDYDDYYDDGEYDDYDDGYDADYGDDAYDDGYEGGDYFYQRQLDRVLDELSDIKRNMKSKTNNSSNVPNQVHFAPDISWPPQVPQVPSRITPYNHYSLYGNSMQSSEPADSALKDEIYQLKEQLGKIRDDIGVAKHEQRLQAEIAKLKDDFSKERMADQRANENRREMLSEIAKLNSNTELEKMRSTFELEKIKSSAELEKIKAAAELEKIKLSAELERTKADTEMSRLGSGLDLNNRLNVDNSFKKEIDRLSGQLDYLRDNNTNSIYGAEIARLSAQVLALSNGFNGPAPVVAPIVAPVAPAPVAHTALGGDSYVKDEVARIGDQIAKMSEKLENDRYFSSEFERVNRSFDDMAMRSAHKDIKSSQYQFNNNVLQELRQLSEKVEALPKNELSPQEDSYYDYFDGDDAFVATLEGSSSVFTPNNFQVNTPNNISVNADSVTLPLSYVNAVAKNAYRSGISNPSITVNVPRQVEQPAHVPPSQDTIVANEVVSKQLDSINLMLNSIMQQSNVDNRDEIRQIVDRLSGFNTAISTNVDANVDKLSTVLSTIHNQVLLLIDRADTVDSSNFAISSEIGKVKNKVDDLADLVHVSLKSVQNSNSAISSLQDKSEIIDGKLGQLLSKTDLTNANYDILLEDSKFVRDGLYQLQSTGLDILNNALGIDEKNTLNNINQEIAAIKLAINDLVVLPQILKEHVSDKAILNKLAELSLEINTIGQKLAANEKRFDEIRATDGQNDMLISELGQISTRMGVDLSNVSNQLLELQTSMQGDVQFIKHQIESTLSEDQGDDVITNVLEELQEIKQNLNSSDGISQLNSLVQEMREKRLIEQEEVASELEGLRGDISDSLLKNSEFEVDALVIKGDIEKVLKSIDEIKTTIEESQAEDEDLTTTNGDSSQILTELGEIKAGIEELKEEVATIAEQVDEFENTQIEAEDEMLEGLEALKTFAETTHLKDEALATQVAAIKEMVQKSTDTDSDSDLNILTQQLQSIHSSVVQTAEQSNNSDLKISHDLVALRAQIEQLGLDVSVNGGVISGNIKQELDALKEQLATQKQDGNMDNALDLLSMQNSINNTLNSSLNNIASKVEHNHSMMQQSQVGILSALDSVAVQLSKKDETSESDSNKKLNDIEQHQVSILSALNSISAQVSNRENGVSADISKQLNDLHKDLFEMEGNKSNGDNQVLEAINALRVQLGRLKISEEGIEEYDNAMDNILLEELVALRSAIAGPKNENLDEQIANINENLNQIVQDLDKIKSDGSINGALDVIMLQNEITELRTLTDLTSERLQQNQTNILAAVQAGGSTDGVSLLDSLRQELSVLRQDFNQVLVSNNETGDAVDGMLLEELVALKSTIQDLQQSPAVIDTAALQSVLDTIKSEVSELSNNSNSDAISAVELGEQLSSLKAELLEGISTTANSSMLDELRSELATLGQRLESSLNKSDDTGLEEIKKSLTQLKNATNKLVTNNDFVNEFAEQFELLQKELQDVKKTKEAPDLSILTEILQVRNEFDSVKNQLSKLVDNAPNTQQLEVDNQNIVNELMNIKRDLFNVSMANVGDNGVDEFENYNQILFDEISSLREQLQELKDNQDGLSSTPVDDVLAEIATLKEAIDTSSQKLLSSDNEIDDKLDRLRDELSSMIKNRQDSEDEE